MNIAPAKDGKGVVVSVKIPGSSHASANALITAFYLANLSDPRSAMAGNSSGNQKESNHVGKERDDGRSALEQYCDELRKWVSYQCLSNLL
ncbi:hypothetical protein COOONC_16314 [Cooperia oncophora]